MWIFFIENDGPVCYHYFIIFENATAEKETLATEPDRKTASPTESAVMGETAKGTLRSRYVETAVGISVGTRYVHTRGDACVCRRQTAFQCGWYRGIRRNMSRPGIQESIPGLFFAKASITAPSPAACRPPALQAGAGGRKAVGERALEQCPRPRKRKAFSRWRERQKPPARRPCRQEPEDGRQRESHLQS